MAQKRQSDNTIAQNRKAYHNYQVEESIESGIELLGSEVKSLKTGQLSFGDSYCRIIDAQVWLFALHISPYKFTTLENHQPLRRRRLLLHRAEIKKLQRKVDERGYTLIPLRFYLKKGLIKLNLGLCRGKRDYDKRQQIKERDVKQQMQRDSRHNEQY